jgi:hypothetical protein
MAFPRFQLSLVLRVLMGWFRFWRLHRIRLPARATPADFEGLGISKKPMQCCLFLKSVGVTVKSAEPDGVAGNVSDPCQARGTPDVHLQELRGNLSRYRSFGDLRRLSGSVNRVVI